MYIYLLLLLLLLLLLSLSLSLTLGEDDDDSIDFDDHPQHTIMSLSFSLSVLSLIVFFRRRKSHNKTQRNTYVHTLSLTIYYRLIVIDDDASVSISSTMSLFCACKFVVNVDKTPDNGQELCPHFPHNI